MNSNIFKNAPFSKAGLVSSLVVFIHRAISGYFRYKDNPDPKIALFEGERVLITTGASLVGNVVHNNMALPALKRLHVKGSLLPTVAFGLITTLFVVAGEVLSRQLADPTPFDQRPLSHPKQSQPESSSHRPQFSHKIDWDDLDDYRESLQHKQQNMRYDLMSIKKELPPVPSYYQPSFHGMPGPSYARPRVFSDFPRL